MKHPKDVVWDEITESAKRQFDYEAYRATFGELGNENVPDNILFMIIEGYASGDSSTKITETVSQQLAMIGFAMPGLEEFVKSKETELKTEIKATRGAIDGFNMGLKGPGVLLQVRTTLAKYK